jgi:hypothetical protein
LSRRNFALGSSKKVRLSQKKKKKTESQLPTGTTLLHFFCCGNRVFEHTLTIKNVSDNSAERFWGVFLCFPISALGPKFKKVRRSVTSLRLGDALFGIFFVFLLGFGFVLGFPFFFVCYSRVSTLIATCNL